MHKETSISSVSINYPHQFFARHQTTNNTSYNFCLHWLHLHQSFHTSYTQEQFLNKSEGETEESEEDTVILPDGHNSASKYSEGDEFDVRNPNTWPINSKEARAARHEFVQEGFRKLYAKAMNENALPAAQLDIIAENDGEVEQNDHVLAAAVEELGFRFGRLLNDVDEGSEESTDSPLEDWMYLPQ